MGRRLVLHIGAHKTGTTSIQKFLFQNRSSLQEAGVSYVVPNENAAHLHEYLQLDRSVLTHPHFKADVHGLLELLSSASGDVVIGSSENFSFLFDPREVSELASALQREFSDIKIVCYLRRQDRHVISHHQEGAKPYRVAEELLWGNSTRALPARNAKQSLYLDYERRLSYWANSFGEGALLLRPFEKSELVNGDVVDDFVHHLGMAGSSLVPVSRQNESLGVISTKVGHLAHQAQLPGPLHAALLEALPASLIQMPSKRSAENFYQAYREGNRRLNERFQVTRRPFLFDDDFSNYPIEDRDSWDEGLANEAVSHILGFFLRAGSSFSSFTPDDWRDAAVALEDSKPELALRFLEVAHFLRPEGPFIRKKLEELRRRMDGNS